MMLPSNRARASALPRRWVVRPVTSLNEYRDLWDRLNRLNGDHALLDSTFVDCLLRHFGAPSTQLALCLDSDTPGVALVEPVKPGFWQTFQPSQAPLGLILIGRPAPDHPQARALLKSLPGYALAFSILHQDPDFTGFHDHRPPLIERLDYIQTARLTVCGTFEDYWKSRSKNLVHNLSRQRRRLSEQKVRLDFVADREPARVVEGIRVYGLLEGKGWKAAHGTAVDPDNRQGHFYRDLLERFCARGEGVIYRLLMNGRTVAIDLCLERNGMLVILKTTYEEEISGLSLGLLLHQEIVKAAFSERRLKVIEFYGPVSDWHTKWTSEVRTMYHVTLYRGAWVPSVNALVRACTRAVSRR